MPLGDSITAGYQSSTGNGYRGPLYNELASQGNTLDFVGSQRSGSMSDPDEEGIYGDRIDQIASLATGALATYKPNIITLHIGSNDLNGNYQVSTAPARLASLIDQIIAVDPDATVLVAQLICNANATTEANIVAYNNQIPAIVQARSNAGKHVYMVSMSSLTTADLYDGLHPNDAGYQKMADNWDAAIQHVIAAGWITPPLNAPIFSGNYGIVNAASNLALGVTSTASSAPVIQQPYTGAAGQIWSFVPTSNGYYQIKNVGSGLDANVSGASTANGASVIQWPFGSPQGCDQWIPLYHWDGTLSFYNLNSQLALDDPAASTASGTQFDQYFPNGTPAQKFIVVPLGTIANGTYHLTPACATGSHLDVAAAGTTDGTNVDIYASNTSNAQKWTFTANAAGNGYRISPLSSPGLSLDVAGAGVANGTNVDIWTSNTTSAQKWGLTAVSGGYTLTPLCATGTRLDVAAGASTNFTNVDIYQANGTNAQTWAIAP
ncbi:hypothetical protein CCAX7_13980 [Capsulimonas corticalis]|uniref:Ricin B lectin domain-containing protein n=1 Tax=Capsulimonas corticalis TaxID=2219043 RepID=A0A9N7L0U0_9BACT|nr:RICIN domain-containing protein [Capsulimonas corticalis]BDI29347.1 hypothetical protein CCAX7_13980 [Capsulimonas corticalis]